MDKVALGKKLRAIRRKKRMSHGDLRRASHGFIVPGSRNVVEGVWESHQSGIENGWHEPSLSTLEKIAAGLNMPFWRLLLELFCEDNRERRAAIREAKERTQGPQEEQQKQPQNHTQSQP